MASTNYSFDKMFAMISDQSQAVQDAVKSWDDTTKTKSFDPGEMFKMQLQMNLLSQFTEGVSGLMAALHTASSSVARKISQ